MTTSEPTKATYWAACDHIKSGDLIAVHTPGGRYTLTRLVGDLVKFFTRSTVYHVVIAVWVETEGGTRHLMCVEANIHGGKRVVPLSTYEERELDIFHLPEGCEYALMEPVLFEGIATTNYSLMDFVSIGLRERLGIKNKNFDGKVCSELCADAWRAAGFQLHTSVLSPGKLIEELALRGITPALRAGRV